MTALPFAVRFVLTSGTVIAARFLGTALVSFLGATALASRGTVSFHRFS
jgi:hypothetical protein